MAENPEIQSHLPSTGKTMRISLRISEVIKVITGVFLTDPWLSTTASFFGVMLRFEIDLGISWDSRIEHYTGDMFQFEISTEVAIFHILGTVFIGESCGR